ncbi:MAG TPA: hypothetical protein PLX58_00090 [Smithellaceae bacterium]|nr:hypothetical protein [Smithellaceae bacterium]
MQKRVGFIAVVSVLAVLLALPSWGWQGRMAGMGDAAGLVADESDFLIHPAAIATGKGFNAYGHYRLTYEKTKNWEYSASVPAMDVIYPFTADGRLWKHEGQLGAALGLGPGRLGVFFDYTTANGKYTGTEVYEGFSGPGYENFELENKLDNFALKAIYGLPVGPVNVGAELGLAYVKEEQKNLMPTEMLVNYPWGAEDYPEYNLLPYMIPFDSKYWEANAKVSAAGKTGPVSYMFTLRGGLPFAADNEYVYSDLEDPESFWAEGKVKGFNVAGDLWMRYAVSDNISLPFVVSAGFKKITRDGSGFFDGGFPIEYEHEAKDIFVTVGGGAEMTPTSGTRLAAGLYYNYLKSEQNAQFIEPGDPSWYFDNYTDMPKTSEHRLTLRLLAEQELNSVLSLRGGLSAFYGLAKRNYSYIADGYFWITPSPVSVSADGAHYGVNASLGASIKAGAVVLEPFINAGYAKFKTDGDGFTESMPTYVEVNKTNWLAGGGLSVKF